MIIRHEKPDDYDAIHRLTERAFAPMPYSDGTEAAIIRALRCQGDLTLSLVAVAGQSLLGHVAFSPLQIIGSSDAWYGLGPISVTPEHQRRGIGSKLVKAGLTALKAQGGAGCALIGNPAVYEPMGFRSNGRLTYGSLSPEYVQFVHWHGPVPSGELKFAPGFEQPSQT